MSSSAPSADQPNALTPEPGVEPDGIDTPTLVMWGFVSVVLVVCVMLAAAALFYNVQNSINQSQVISRPYPEAEKTFTDQQSVLASYKTPDGEGQPYRIPIEQAKRLVIKELGE